MSTHTNQVNRLKSRISALEAKLAAIRGAQNVAIRNAAVQLSQDSKGTLSREEIVIALKSHLPPVEILASLESVPEVAALTNSITKYTEMKKEAISKIDQTVEEAKASVTQAT